MKFGLLNTTLVDSLLSKKRSKKGCLICGRKQVECLYDIPENQFYHITQLIQKYLEQGERIGTYPISEESWMDMGQFDEMESMLKKIK